MIRFPEAADCSLEMVNFKQNPASNGCVAVGIKRIIEKNLIFPAELCPLVWQTLICDDDVNGFQVAKQQVGAGVELGVVQQKNLLLRVEQHIGPDL